ncbi:NB-ARC domain-containing protein [Pleurocapsa sp. PCC 7319]|uniref:WD40 domain-containing protein n=1 Tax=Pleurocapsa sp. PCC 7319 TaxID=118161 RepID=UPI000345CF8C|nr:NB-ARC domain-containing protein [Pleurocapsa sp. PCC 7319]
MFKISEDLLQAIALEQNISQIELGTLKLALLGKSAIEIATVLDVSAVAVRKRLGSVYQKFDLPGKSPGKLVALKNILTERSQQLSQVKQVQFTQDWGDAIDVADFYGRELELEHIEKWAIEEHCRLITLLGMGGIGKTTLSIKLAQKIAPKFDFVVWRSLRSAPAITDVVEDIYNSLSQQQQDLPANVGDRTKILLNEYLRQYRCLIVLDNLESILQSETRAGAYRPGCEDYGEFLRQIGEIPHSSCVVLTSRELPKEVALLAGNTKPIKIWRLQGLQTAGKSILQAEGLFGSETKLQELIDNYAGNPLALRIAATTIKNLFGGNIDGFLAQKVITFGDISDLLREQLVRLSDLEREIMYWLAIEREPATLNQLQSNFVIAPTIPQLLEAIESLTRRSLVEVEERESKFTLQNVIVEYLYDRLIESICQEITAQKSEFLNNYALLQATAKEYIRDAQAHLLLEPVKNRLLALLGDRSQVESQLKQIIATWRQKTESTPRAGYTAGNILNLLCQLQSDLRKYDFSHLAIRQAYLQNINLPEVNFAYSHFSQCVFSKIFGGVLSVAYSPDGQYLATGDTNGEIILWEVNQGRLKSRIRADSNWIRSVAFSPNGQFLASTGENQTIKIWSMVDDSCIQMINDVQNQVWVVSFSPDGSTIVSAGEDKTVKIWSVESGQCLKTFVGHSDCVRSVAFSLDGQYLASGSEDKTVKIWSVASGQCLNTFTGHNNWIRAVAFSLDGQYLASGSEDKTVKIWSVASGQCLDTFTGHNNWVWSLAYSPDGQYLASGSADRTIKIWHLATSQCQQTLAGHQNWVQSIAYSPDGQYLASGSTDRTVKIWHLATSQCQQTLQGHSIWMRAIAYSPDGQYLVSGGEDKTVKIWLVENGQCLKNFVGHSNWVQSVAYSPDGQYIASSSPDRTIEIWELKSGKSQEILETNGNWSRTLAFSPDSKTLVSGNEDSTVKIWSVKSGQCLATFTGHENWVSSVAYSPDCQYIASGSSDRTIKIWEIKSGQCLNTFSHENWVSSVAYSPDGQYIASSSSDRTIKIWEIKSGQCRTTFSEHENHISSVAYSPNGQYLASGSEDQTIKIWELKSDRCINTLSGHSNWVSSVAFSPDSKYLASTSIDETIKLWDLTSGHCLKTMRSTRPYEAMNIYGAKGLSTTQIAVLQALGAKLESNL